MHFLLLAFLTAHLTFAAPGSATTGECDGTSLVSIDTPSGVVRTDLERLHVISHPNANLEVHLRPVFRQGKENHVHVSIVDPLTQHELSRYEADRATMMNPDAVKFAPDGEHLLLRGRTRPEEPFSLFSRDKGWVEIKTYSGHMDNLTFGSDAIFLDADQVFASHGAHVGSPVRYSISRQSSEKLTERKERRLSWAETLGSLFGGGSSEPERPPRPDWVTDFHAFTIDYVRHLALATHGNSWNNAEWNLARRQHVSLWNLRTKHVELDPLLIDLGEFLDLQTYGNPHEPLHEMFKAEGDSHLPITSETESIAVPIVRSVRPGVFAILLNSQGQVTWQRDTSPDEESPHVYKSSARLQLLRLDVDHPVPESIWKSPIYLDRHNDGINVRVTDGELRIEIHPDNSPEGVEPEIVKRIPVTTF